MLIEDWMKKSKQERQSHLDLEQDCIERGGTWTQFRGILVVFLDTSFPKDRKIHLCHGCNNEKCSNPKHLYWGTASENRFDAIEAGRVVHPKGHPQTEDTRRKISQTLKGRPSNNKRKISP